MPSSASSGLPFGPRMAPTRLTRAPAYWCDSVEFRVWLTHRLHSSSFLGLPYRILDTIHKKELHWSLWVGFRIWGLGCRVVEVLGLRAQG